MSLGLRRISLTAVTICFCFVLIGAKKEPVIQESPAGFQVHVYEGDDALITCVVRNANNNTLMWKTLERGDKKHSTRVLTAGETRLTADKRVDILHDKGGDVWVLSIREVQVNDSGIYICELNTDPVSQTFHQLTVLSRGLQPPSQTVANFTKTADWSGSSEAPPTSYNHNYTDCCIASNVSEECRGFCSIQNILDGTTGRDPEHCEADFPSIVSCMSDSRNHVPCCMEQGIPDICQDVCRGEYTLITDNIKTHFSCSAYTEQTLACIVKGIRILPSSPAMVDVESLSEDSLGITWDIPLSNGASVTEYVVNVTSLKTFDNIPGLRGGLPANSSQNIVVPHSIQVKIPGSDTSATVMSLVPFTMYEVSIVAHNKHGSSMPSLPVRTLTMSPTHKTAPKGMMAPKLPDIKACCKSKNVTHSNCLNKLCDPVEAAITEVTDLMICAPWTSQTFSCLTNGIDHTDCCKSQGLPDSCLNLCSGNISQIDFSYFKCVKYMSSYSNCLLQGYGVVPSAPHKLSVSNIDTRYAILHWSPPRTLGDTVRYYNAYLRESEDLYEKLVEVESPYILENLKPDTQYEVYMEAVNMHGASEPSERILFSTMSLREEELEEDNQGYNVTACCVEAGVNDLCAPLCSYDASMSQVKTLAPMCAIEIHKILRCGAGGRNHGACCTRRGVPPNCSSICAGVVNGGFMETAAQCIPYIGNIVQCFEEGTGLLPGPVRELHAIRLTSTSVTLKWEPPLAGSTAASDYVVHYQKVQNISMYETVLKLDQEKIVNDSTVTLTDLETGHFYNIFVVSRNEHGTSLPTAILLVNITNMDLNKEGIKGVTSPPHVMAVSDHNANWLMVTWQPPEFSQAAEQLTYRLFWKASSDASFKMVETSITSHTLENLKPNTKYIIYTIAVSKTGASLPSETLLAWTDPAYPAFVEPPTVHPINLVMEGSSMTILCIAMGTPMPTISLYISSRLVRQETTRHMVTVIHNVTRDMDQISCYADNGYGTPMQASRRIVISHVPHLTASGITMAKLGDSVTLECVVDAYPEPKLFFWRDPDGRKPVIVGGKYAISFVPSKEEEHTLTMQLTINKLIEDDEGDYYCHAENAFGVATQPVSVRIRNAISGNLNVSQCCREQNVSSECMDACSFYMDIDAIIEKPGCFNEFDKLMKCAADGSDHRSCCARTGVPRRCLDWCRGAPIQNSKMCVLSYTRSIMACFHEGKENLPGPPINIRAEYIDPHSVLVSWDPPLKNPETVEVYRVFWRQVGAKEAAKTDVKQTSLRITGLKSGSPYECVLKAGNHLGTSTMTEPIKFLTGDWKLVGDYWRNREYITTSSNIEDHSEAGTAFGVLLALAIVGVIVAGAIWFMRAKHLLVLKSPGGTAFENPSYMREVNMEHMQGSTDQPHIISGNTPAVQGWKHESLHVPAATEVPPSLYEELKLGQDGAGFKRLKP